MNQKRLLHGLQQSFLFGITADSVSVMEETDMRHCHEHAVLVRCFNDVVIADGSAALGDIGDAALVGALDIVAEGEEGVRTEGDARRCPDPGRSFFGQEDRRFFREDPLPFVCAQKVHAFIG